MWNVNAAEEADGEERETRGGRWSLGLGELPPRWLAGEGGGCGRSWWGCASGAHRVLLALPSPFWVGCRGGAESPGPAVGFTAGSCRRRGAWLLAKHLSPAPGPCCRAGGFAAWLFASPQRGCWSQGSAACL